MNWPTWFFGLFLVRASPPPVQRLAFGAGALVAAVAVGLVLANGSGPTVPAVIVFVIAPDLPLFFGHSRRMGLGQVHPQVVRVYNATHRLIGPEVLVAVAAVIGPDALQAGALTWLTHVLFDRAAGWGPRRPDGWLV